MSKTLNVYKKIETLRERYYTSSVKKESLLKMISEAEVADQVYNSNAIENSTLTLEETEKILLQIGIDRYITERELFETKNLAKVVTYIEVKAKEQELNLDMILLLHKILLSDIRDDVAGRFRQDSEQVKVANYIAPDPKFIVEQLEEMLVQYNSTSSENIIKKIAPLHLVLKIFIPLSMATVVLAGF